MSVSKVILLCTVLGAQGIHAMGFKHAQGNAHCAKFESYTSRMTFETNAICTKSDIQPPRVIFYIQTMTLSNTHLKIYSIHKFFFVFVKIRFRELHRFPHSPRQDGLKWAAIF